MVAAIGTLALVANLLVPGLTHAAVTNPQTGTAIIGCSTDAPSFSVTPSSAFSFYGDGSSTAITASFSDQKAFNNPDGDLNSAADTNYIQVHDGRDPSVHGCNDGFNVTVVAGDATSLLAGLTGVVALWSSNDTV